MKKKNPLYQNDGLFHLMADNILDGLAILENNRVVYVNDRLCEITGYTRHELLRLDSFTIIAPEVRKGLIRDYGDHEPHKMFEENEYEIVRKNGVRRIVHNRHSHLLNDAGDKILYHFEIITDITDRKTAEKKLKTLNRTLEDRVEERTTELRKANEELQAREKELKAQKKSLEELNAALRVLLKKGEEDKKELEEKMLFNVRELALPYVDKVMQSRLDPNQLECLKVIKANLDDIISPFGRRLSVNGLKLTPKEIHIANLVKQGRTTKEIAALLRLSERTITTHRDNIRTKLGLKVTKANLRTHLLAIT